MGMANQAVCLYGEYDRNLDDEEFLKRLSSGTMIDEEVKEKEDEDKHCLKSGKTEELVTSLNNEYENHGRMAKCIRKVFDGSPARIPLIPERDENPWSFLFKLEIHGNSSKKIDVIGIRNSYGLEKLCVKLTGTCAPTRSAGFVCPKQLKLEGKEISHGDSSFCGSNTAAQSEEGLNTREAEEESLPVVLSFPQTAKEFSRSPASLPNKLPENEDTSRSEINVETPECTIGVGASDKDAASDKEGEDLKTQKEGVGTQDKDATLPTSLGKEGKDLNKGKKADKDSFRKNKKDRKNTNRSEYGAMKLEEDFSFRHQKSFGSLVLQCIEAFGKVFIACSSVLFCYMYLPLLALLLLIPSSNGLSTEKPKMDCLSQVVDIKIKLDAQATCNTQEIPISCDNGELAVCLHIVFENVMAWGCAPNICINGHVCAEFSKRPNGLYMVQGGRNCITCPPFYTLSEWKEFPECYNRTEQYPNNTMAPPAENKQTLSPGATAVIVVIGVLAALVGIAIALYCFCNRRQTWPTFLSLCRPSCCNTNPTNERVENEGQNTPMRENEQNGTTIQLENVDQNGTTNAERQAVL